MRELFLSEAKLEERRKGIAERLRAAIPGLPFISAEFQPVGVYTKVIGVNQGHHRIGSYSNWRVSLVDHPVSIGYFEVWQYKQDQRRRGRYLLLKAYLHVYLAFSPENEKQMIFLHCDPQEQQDSDHFRHKVAPHIHVQIAGSPWSDAHIPLCDGWQDEVLASLDSLDRAFTRGIEFIVNEVCPLAKNLLM